MNGVTAAPALRWRAALVTIVLVELCLLGLFHETAMAMVRIWIRSETFTHAFLVLPISLWLIWEKRGVLGLQDARPCPWFLILLAGLACIWLLGELAAVNSVTQLAFTAIVVCVVPLIIGPAATRQIAFPLAYLFFAVPLGEFAMPKLMEWTATFTVMGLQASGVPVYQEGLHFVIPSGSWSVIEACSGVRYLLASITVGTLFAYLNYRSLNRRLVFIGFSILVPILANWVRAYLIVMLGHLSGNKLAVGVDHLIYGWVFFGLVITIMFAVGMRWREPETAPAVNLAVSCDDGFTGHRRRTGLAITALLALGIASAPHLALQVLGAEPPPFSPVLMPQPLVPAGWQLVESNVDWQPAFANPSATMHSVLVKGDRRVGVYIVWYRRQSYEHKLISSDNVLVRSEDKLWTEIGHSVRQIILAGRPLMVREGKLSGDADGLGTEPFRLKVWHWYWIGGKAMISDPLGKIRLALLRLTGQDDGSAAVFIYAAENQPDGAEAALADYLADVGTGISAVLERVSAQR